MDLVGQAATIAQFTGVDAYGLIKMIAEAAQTVQRNKRACLQLARRAKMIGDLLRQLHGAQLMQQPETRNPVEELEETLRRALLLVRSCRGRGYLYRCFMGARHADELREVQGEISFYLQLFPLVSYVDTTLTWVRLLSKADADPSCNEAPVGYKVPGSEEQSPGAMSAKKSPCCIHKMQSFSFSRERLPLSAAQERTGDELCSSNKAQVQLIRIQN